MRSRRMDLSHPHVRTDRELLRSLRSVAEFPGSSVGWDIPISDSFTALRWSTGLQLDLTPWMCSWAICSKRAISSGESRAVLPREGRRKWRAPTEFWTS